MNKKFLTKLLNKNFRKSVIASMSPAKMTALEIPQYARYTCDKVIISRNKEHENDKDWLYGFSPLEVLAYVDKDGNLVTRLFEFNSVNHFLKLTDGDTAVEVITAILVDWVKSEKDKIANFNIDAIDAGLAKIESEYVAEQKTESEVIASIQQKIGEFGQMFTSWPVKFEDFDGIGNDVCMSLKEIKNKYELVSIAVNFQKTTREMLDKNEFCITVSWKHRKGRVFKTFDAMIRKQSESAEG